MKQYRTELIAAAFLALLMLSILLVAPLRGQSPGDTPPVEPAASLALTGIPSTLDTPSTLVTASETPAPSLEGTFPRCSGSISGLCLVSVGTDALNGNSVFSLNVRGTDLNDLYLLVSDAATNRYECQSVESLPSMLYCAGPSIAPGTLVNIEVYARADDRLLTVGTLLIKAELTPVTGGTPTPVYPSYPSYP